MTDSAERLRRLSRFMKLMILLGGAVFCSAVVYMHWQIFFDRQGFEQGIRDVVFPAWARSPSPTAPSRLSFS